MKYNWQQKGWPEFSYNLTGIEDLLYQFSGKIGYMSGVLKTLSEDTKTQAIIDMMVSEAVKTSEIEGEFLSRKDVMSSIKNNLGLNKELEPVRDRRAAGIARLMVDVRENFKKKLSRKTLFSWHEMLMEGSRGVKSGAWRTHMAPMQVISGLPGKEVIHFEAPPSDHVPEEMMRFIRWYNNTGPGGENEIKNAAVRSAIVHVYFESIHPFEDGNGRMGRVLSEKALYQGIGNPVLLSLSKAIEAKKGDYYEAIKQAQRSNEISAWVRYFVSTILEAQDQAEAYIDFTIKKTKFFDQHGGQLNARQTKVINRMLKQWPEVFDGGMSAKKYMAISKTSKATATRDLQMLVALGVFIPVGGGRSVRYDLRF